MSSAHSKQEHLKVKLVIHLTYRHICVLVQIVHNYVIFFTQLRSRIAIARHSFNFAKKILFYNLALHKNEHDSVA